MRKVSKDRRILDTAFVNNSGKVLGLVSLIAISGCLCPACPDPNNFGGLNCSNETGPLNAQLGNLQAELARLNSSLQQSGVELSAALQRIQSLNQSLQNCSIPPTNASVYKFSCRDWLPDLYFQTSHVCAWEVRAQYGTGYYTSMADMCIGLGLPSACSCMNTIPEFVGTRLSTGLGVSG